MRWITEPEKITASVGVTGAIVREHLLEDTGGPFFLDQTSQTVDPIMDDMSIWIMTGRGVVIITGCCHAGLINTVCLIRRISGMDRVRGIVGGLHLLNASCDRLEATCNALLEWNPEFVIPCHCTGAEAVSLLQNELGCMVTPGYAGLELNLTK